VDGQAGAADVDGFLDLPRAAALLCELRKCNRRRILLDPASKIFDPLIVCHSLHLLHAAAGDRVDFTASLTRWR
jgi:hypothetical protein